MSRQWNSRLKVSKQNTLMKPQPFDLKKKIRMCKVSCFSAKNWSTMLFWLRLLWCHQCTVVVKEVLFIGYSSYPQCLIKRHVNEVNGQAIRQTNRESASVRLTVTTMHHLYITSTLKVYKPSIWYEPVVVTLSNFFIFKLAHKANSFTRTHNCYSFHSEQRNNA